MDLDALLAEAEAYTAQFNTVRVESQLAPQDTVMVSMPTMGEIPRQGRPKFDDPCNPKQIQHFVGKCKYHYIPSPLGGVNPWTRITRLECKRMVAERDPSVELVATVVEDKLYIG